MSVLVETTRTHYHDKVDTKVAKSRTKNGLQVGGGGIRRTCSPQSFERGENWTVRRARNNKHSESAGGKER